jgi:hypothetical protein
LMWSAMARFVRERERELARTAAAFDSHERAG